MFVLFLKVNLIVAITKTQLGLQPHTEWVSNLPRKFVTGQDIPPQNFNFAIKFLLKGTPPPKILNF